MNGNPAIKGLASGSSRLRSTALGVAIAAALALGTVATLSATSRNVPVLRGPEINRTLGGGVARDLSPQELRYVNQAAGLAER